MLAKKELIGEFSDPETNEIKIVVVSNPEINTDGLIRLVSTRL